MFPWGQIKEAVSILGQRSYPAYLSLTVSPSKKLCFFSFLPFLPFFSQVGKWLAIGLLWLLTLSRGILVIFKDRLSKKSSLRVYYEFYQYKRSVGYNLQMIIKYTAL